MRKRTLHWELLGAAVGAGLASGREIASFFGRYGAWSWGLIALAAAVIALAAPVQMPRQLAGMWRALVTLLLVATGGGMLSGAGEVASALPVPGAYQIGAALTMLLAWWLAQRTENGLARVSRGMLLVLAGLILSGLLLPPMRAVRMEEAHVSQGLVLAMCYGGFNAALISPVLAYSGADPCGGWRSLVKASLLLWVLLMLGNAVLLRHPALMAEPLPFVRMSAEWGRIGRWVAAAGLYLAILSTLTACVRGVQGHLLALGGMVLAACLGFTGVVEVLYPVLGGGCLLLMGIAKFTNYNRSAFHSRRDVL